MNAITPNPYAAAWRRLGRELPRPKAILAISAHWLTRGTGATAMAAPRTIHDFGGFPRELFEVSYPAPGSPALAARLRDLLHPVDVALDQSWGFDHGTWSVLMHVFPDADIPIVQLSMDGTLPPRFHYELGSRLRPLREEGVLIVGSGNIVHNLRAIDFAGKTAAYPWAEQFDRAVTEALQRRDHEALIAYDRLTPQAMLSVPTNEHYLPLLYIIGLQAEDEPLSFPIEGMEMASLSMRSVAIGRW
jgi:4,5-DOPA dioxygenase extradiol